MSGAAVQFFEDANGNRQFDLGADRLIGEDRNGGDGFTFSQATVTSPPMARTIHARARNISSGRWTNDAPLSTTVIVNPDSSPAPILTATPSPVTAPDNVTLTATFSTSVYDAVQFFEDANGNRRLDLGIDILAGQDVDGMDGWSAMVGTENASGSPVIVEFLSRARDAVTRRWTNDSPLGVAVRIDAVFEAGIPMM